MHEPSETKMHTVGMLKTKFTGSYTEIVAVDAKGVEHPVPVVMWPGLDDSGRTIREHRANADRLALCWNSHDALVEACRGLLAAIGDPPRTLVAADAARVALSLAQGRSK